jgi:hypothetical protein
MMEQDKEWQALLAILRFIDARTQKGLESLYVDLPRETVDVQGLRDHAMSMSQKYLVMLALHLFNCEDNPLPKNGLRGIDMLSGDYYKVAIQAIKIRFSDY